MMTGMKLNMETLEMVAGGAIQNPEECQCTEHKHNYVKIEEDWVSPCGGVYFREHFRCTDCGDDYWTDWVNTLYD